MEVLRAEEYQARTDLAAQVKEYMDQKGMTIQQIADEVGCSRTTLSRYLNGKYNADVSTLEGSLRRYIGGEPEQPKPPKPKKTGKRKAFFQSSDSSSVLGVCALCQENQGLGVVVGPSGYGKSYALQHYASLPRVVYLECDDSMGIRDLASALNMGTGQKQVNSSVWQQSMGIRQFFKDNPGYLLIVDEADKLIGRNSTKKLEILRAIYDQSNVGMVIAGEPMLEAQIKTLTERFANRVDFYASLKGLKPKEVEAYVEDLDIEPKAVDELIRRGCNKRTGCFRVLDRTLNNVFRILKERDETRITLEIINQASGMLML